MHIDFMQFIICLFLMPICSTLNHLGGQSTTIPDPRITCRVFGIGIAFGAVALLSGVDIMLALKLCGIATAGMALWTVWAWGSMFMACNGEDSRKYTDKPWNPNFWLTHLTDRLLGVNQLSVLTPMKCRTWGMIYGTLRGLFMYPMFIALAIFLTPAAVFIGAGSALQGFVYRISPLPIDAEYVFGLLIGAMLAAVLIIYHMGGLLS